MPVRILTSHVEMVEPGETYEAFTERLQSYLPDGATLESPNYQKWVQKWIGKHREEAALLRIAPSLTADQAARLRTLQNERLEQLQRHADQSAAGTGLPASQLQPKLKLPGQPKAPPEDPAVAAARRQVSAAHLGLCPFAGRLGTWVLFTGLMLGWMCTGRH